MTINTAITILVCDWQAVTHLCLTLEILSIFISYRLRLVHYGALSKLSLIQAQRGSKTTRQKNSLNRGLTSWCTQNTFEQWPKFCKVTPVPQSIGCAKMCRVGWRLLFHTVSLVSI